MATASPALLLAQLEAAIKARDAAEKKLAKAKEPRVVEKVVEKPVEVRVEVPIEKAVVVEKIVEVLITPEFDVSLNAEFKRHWQLGYNAAKRKYTNLK